MVGLSHHDAAQVRELLSVRRRLSLRRFKGRPQEALLTVVFLVFALPVPILFATFSGIAYRRLETPWDAELLGGVLALLWVIWLLAPLFGASLNESPDMSRLLALPIRRRVMIIATFAGSVFDYSTFFTLPFLLAVLLGGWGTGALLVVVLAVLIAALHFIAAGQLMTTITSGLVRSRRFRDLITVIGSLAAVSFWWLRMRTMESQHVVLGYLRRIPQNDIHPLEVLQWTPPGACARAIERASTGHVGEALVWLAGSVCALVALVAVWWWAQDRVATRGEFVFGAPKPRAHADAKRAGVDRSPRIPFLRPALIAVAVLELRQTWRNPRRRMQTVNGLMMPIVFSVLWFGRARFSGSLLALAPGIFIAFISMLIFQNLMAMDGLAVATVFLSPLDRRDVFRGKALAFATVAAGPVLLLCVLATLRASVSLGISAALLSASTFLIVAAVSSAISARVAVPVQEERRTGPVRANSAAGWTMAVTQPAIAAVLLAPFWIPAAIGIVMGRPALALGSAAAGLVYAAVVFHFGIKNAGAALAAREPEIFKMLDPKAL